MVENDETILLYRYPGTNFFEEKQENIFFGREKESVELIHAIKAHEVYVIFANSGIGKTSLLNARLIPKLKAEQFIPIRFRFQDTSLSPLNEISNKLSEFLPSDYRYDPVKRLWGMYKAADFQKKKVLFIFDQFEEFFNHAKDLRDDCISQLADLNSGYLPDYINREMREKFRAADPTEKELQYYTAVDVKFLFLIRADKLNLLDDLSKEIPLILRNRFHLKPLTVTQAKEAILEPAMLPQNGFAVPPFNLEQVDAHICNYLKNEEDEVESFQLQILCRELERRIIKKYTAHPGKESLTITENELGGDTGMSNIIQNYYQNQLTSIKDRDLKIKATTLIEDELIIDNRRISLPETFLTNKGYPETLLNYLVDNTRLIRGDRIRNDRYFEISHDKLLPPILKARQIRLDEDDKQKKIKQLQEEKELEEAKNKQLQEEKEEQRRQKDEEIQKNRQLRQLKETIEKKSRRLKIFSIFIGVLFLCTLFVFFYANKVGIESKMKTAQYLMSTEDYDQAHKLLALSSAKEFLYIGYVDTLKKLDAIIETTKQQQKNFRIHSARGDSLRSGDGHDLINAYSEYDSAQKVGYKQGGAEIKKKLEDLQKEIDARFKVYVEKMMGFRNAGGLDDAQHAFAVANSLFPKTKLPPTDNVYYKKLLEEFKK